MTCQQCRFENPAGMRFCGQCGAPLALRCPQCGGEVPPQFKFCGQCGASLAAAPASAAPASAAPAPAAPAAAAPAATVPTVSPASRPAVTAVAPSPGIASYTPKHLADKILKSRSALEGERRQVTVLFGDIAG